MVLVTKFLSLDYVCDTSDVHAVSKFLYGGSKTSYVTVYKTYFFGAKHEDPKEKNNARRARDSINFQYSFKSQPGLRHERFFERGADLPFMPNVVPSTLTTS